MPDDLPHLTLFSQPTAARPLLGLTVLVVEDSRFASEALRLLCLRSGARIRRASSLAAARRHLAVYRPTVMIVDIGLPDGSGIDLIAGLAVQEMPNRPVILATTGADGEGFEAQARAAGADGFLAKPIETISQFQQAVLAHLPADLHPSGPRVVTQEAVIPDPLTLAEDLAHIDTLLAGTPDCLSYVAPFLQGLSRLSGDGALAKVAAKLSTAHALGKGRQDAIRELRATIAQRLELAEPV